MSGKEICKELSNNGWVMIRRQFPYAVFKKDGTDRLIVVPLHPNVSIGVLYHIEKITGLSLRKKK